MAPLVFRPLMTSISVVLPVEIRGTAISAAPNAMPCAQYAQVLTASRGPHQSSHLPRLEVRCHPVQELQGHLAAEATATAAFGGADLDGVREILRDVTMHAAGSYDGLLV